jgi:hypothetical protein
MSTPRDSKHRLPSGPQVMTVTPEMAGDWLDHRNTSLKNRNISRLTVANYADTMKRGEWRLTPQALAFDTDGWLLDGQHRLAAVAFAKVSVDFWIFPEEPRDTFALYDVGRKRSASHLLHVPNRMAIASAVRYLGVADGVLAPRSVNQALGQPTVAQTLDLVRAYGLDLELAARVATGLVKTAHTPPSPMAAVLYQALNSEHKDKFDDFIHGVATGENLKLGDPRLRLRNGFLAPPFNRAPLVRTQSMPYALIVKAWNHYVRGTQLHLLVWKESEPVPKVAGYIPKPLTTES